MTKEISSKPSPKQIDTSKMNLKRASKARQEDEVPDIPTPSVSAGPIDKVIELAFNPTRDKIREVTIIDRMQGRLFPVMDALNALFINCVEVATYRQSKQVYVSLFHKLQPSQLNIAEEMLYRIAQWQKSVGGKNLEKAADIALAETETRPGDEGDTISSGRGYEE